MAEPARLPTARLFVGLWPPVAVREALAALQGLWSWPAGAALVPPDRLHLTLHFLGQVPVDRVPALRDALEVPFEPHVLELAQGRWRLWPGGIAVLELAAPAALQRLHAALGAALQSFGWPVEARRYRPHVTFARRATGAQLPRELPSQLQWPVQDGYVLVHSIPGKDYELLHAFGRHSASLHT